MQARYRGTSPIRNSIPLMTTIGPEAQSYCMVLGGAVSYERITRVTTLLWNAGSLMTLIGEGKLQTLTDSTVFTVSLPFWTSLPFTKPKAILVSLPF